MTVIALAFNELFYGAGSWLGLLLLIAMVTGISAKVKYGGVLMFPVCLFLGMNYLTYNLMWNALIMFFLAVFIAIMTALHKEI
jgi:Na+(H+)/acetate symporter ActP